jgi:adenylate cyclase
MRLNAAAWEPLAIPRSLIFPDYALGAASAALLLTRASTTLADVLTRLLDANPFSTVRASFRWQLRGVALLWSRKHDRALAELQRSVAIAPNFAEAHLAMAHVLIYSGDAAGAIDSLDTGMRLDPLYRDIALYFLAEARISLGQFDEAVAALKLRLQRDSNSASSYALLASCYGHLGRIAEAQAVWAEVMKIAPDFSIERRRRILPFRNPDHFEYRIEGMRQAGIPV